MILKTESISFVHIFLNILKTGKGGAALHIMGRMRTQAKLDSSLQSSRPIGMQETFQNWSMINPFRLQGEALIQPIIGVSRFIHMSLHQTFWVLVRIIRHSVVEWKYARNAHD